MQAKHQLCAVVHHQIVLHIDTWLQGESFTTSIFQYHSNGTTKFWKRQIISGDKRRNNSVGNW